MSRALDTSLLANTSWSVAPSVTTAITAFLATTTATTATLPHANQRPLYVPAGLYDAGTDVDILATGAGQVIFGDGANSVFQDTSLLWNAFDYGGAHNLHLRGVSDYGVKASGSLADRLTYANFSNLTIRQKTVAGVSIDGTDNLAGVSNVALSDIMSIGNAVGLDIGFSSNVDIMNFNATANTGPNIRLWGVGETKMVNFRAQAPVDGPGMLIKGTAAKPSLESYFINGNVNEGSYTDNIVATEIAPYDSNTKLKVTTATDHEVAVGWQRFVITSTTYGTLSRWAVSEILSATEVVLAPISGVSPAGPYAATEAGTFNRQKPGYQFDGEVTGSASYLNDMWFMGGSSNHTEFSEVYNITMMGRGVFSKERTVFKDQNNRVLGFGSFRGRNVSTYSDVLPCGPTSHTGWAAFAGLDPTSSLAPGGMHTGIIAPMKDWGVGATTNQPVGYAYALVAEDRVRIGCAAYPALDDDWQWLRPTTGDQLFMSAQTSARITSDEMDNGFEIVGAAGASMPQIKPYGVAAPVLSAAATDLATALTLLNEVRASLIGYGLNT